MSDIFISYASEDRERAEAIAEALEAQGGCVVGQESGGGQRIPEHH